MLPSNVAACGWAGLANVGCGTTCRAWVVRLTRPNSAGAYYYLTYRRALGYDAALRPTYVDRLSIHRWSGSGNTYVIAALGDGQSFTDAANGISVQGRAANPGGGHS